MRRFVSKYVYPKPGTFFRFYSNWALLTYLPTYLCIHYSEWHWFLLHLRARVSHYLFTVETRTWYLVISLPQFLGSRPHNTVRKWFEGKLNMGFLGKLYLSFLHFWHNICAFNPFFHRTVPPLLVSNMKNWCR